MFKLSTSPPKGHIKGNYLIILALAPLFLTAAL